MPSDAESRFAEVTAAFASDRRVTAGRMMASVGLRVDGKIFAMLVRGSLVVKLPAERVAELVSSGRGQQFDPRRDGRLMKEWVVLDGSRPPWLDLAREAYRFVSGAGGIPGSRRARVTPRRSRR
jgi:TfoX/Sxy family transcriptional regulator of competence genes